MKKALKLVSVMIMGTGVGFLGCSGSDSTREDSNSSTTNVVDESDGTSNLSSLALYDVLALEIPSELGSDDSALTTVSKKSRLQCRLRKEAGNVFSELRRVGGLLCHLNEQPEIQIPDAGADANVYKITFAKDPGPDESALAAGSGSKAPRVVKFYITQPEEGTVNIHMCDDHAKQVIEVTTDDYIRSGSIRMHGTNKAGITRLARTDFAVDLESDHIIADVKETRTNADDEVIRRYTHIDLPQDPKNTTVPHKIAFSASGTWNNVFFKRFAAAKLLNGYGLAVIGILARGAEDSAVIWRKALFKTSGAEADSSDLPDADEMAVTSEDIPAPLEDSDDESEPTNNACDAEEYTEITISKADIEAETSCEVAKTPAPNCSDTAKYEAPRALNDDSISIDERTDPSAKAKPQPSDLSSSE